MDNIDAFYPLHFIKCISVFCMKYAKDKTSCETFDDVVSSNMENAFSSGYLR